jgi:hypothetical protein
MSGAPRVLTTLFVRDLPKDCAWRQHSELVAQTEMSLFAWLRTLLRRAPEFDIAILNGSSRPDQLAAMLLRRLRPSLPLLITDCQWKIEASWPARTLTKLGLRVIDGPRTHYAVLSTEDQKNFSTSWGVDPERVFLTFWFPAVSEEEMRAPTSEDGYAFAGGNSLRDYEALIAAARQVPFEVRIATNQPPPEGAAELPQNLTYGPLDGDEYFRQWCHASVVVVPLASGTPRSAGQTTYQSVRALGKLVIVNDATGVREYVDDRRTGLIVPSHDPAALAEAMRWALDPANAAQAREIAAAGKRDVLERFGKVAYLDRMLEIAAEVLPG